MSDNSPRLRVLTLIESNSVTGPSRVLLDFASQAGVAEPGLPAVDVTLVTFRRGDTECALADAAQAAGVPAILIPEKQRWDPGVMPKLRRAVQEFRPDILESRNVKSHFFIRALGLHRQFPWIAWNHGYTARDRLDRTYNQLDRWSLKGAFRVMTVCGPFADTLHAHGIPRHKISILHNFVRPFVAPPPEQVAALRQQLGLAGEKVILTVGRMSSEKGHADLLNAVAMLRVEQALPPYRVVIVGDGPEQDNLARQIVELGLNRAVRLPGFQRDVAPYYALADLFALPSHSEGSPNVVFEAMTAGLPIAATTVGGVPEIIEDGRTGLLIPPRNPVAMAGALERLLMSEDLRRRLGAEAKRTVESNYLFQDYKRKLTNFYVATLQTAARP
jgi:glycosyltransferase involved in cell wall biosynthesis